MQKVKIQCDSIAEVKRDSYGKIEVTLENPNITELVEINQDDLIRALILNKEQFKILMEMNEINLLFYFDNNRELFE